MIKRYGPPIILFALAILSACDREAIEPTESGNNVAEAAPEVSTSRPEASATAEKRSVFTGLTEADCRLLEQEMEEGTFWRRACPGAGGYGLEVTEGDLRQNLIVERADGARESLDLPSVVGSGFSSLGKTAEWRGDSSQPFRPRTLTVRYEILERPDPPQRPTSYLIVVRLDPQPSCVVAIVSPGPEQSARARAIADERSLPACRTAR